MAEPVTGRAGGGAGRLSDHNNALRLRGQGKPRVRLRCPIRCCGRWAPTCMTGWPRCWAMRRCGWADCRPKVMPPPGWPVPMPGCRCWRGGKDLSLSLHAGGLEIKRRSNSMFPFLMPPPWRMRCSAPPDGDVPVGGGPLAPCRWTFAIPSCEEGGRGHRTKPRKRGDSCAVANLRRSTASGVAETGAGVLIGQP